MRYRPVIGLEIHCELLTRSKVFCGCPNSFGGSANTRVCPRCSGMPGTLPLLNQNAMRLAAKAGFATECTVHNYSAFDRKNYFYPDLPKAYQITQFRHPICTGGRIRVCTGRDIRISRIHVEEDAGKLLHDDREGLSMADLNRCGVPLIEIVTEPDLRTVEEVHDFVKRISLRLKYADICDARMEQGSLRTDVNISLMPSGSSKLGTRAEIKNINSFRSIGRAICYEIQRQSEILDKGGRIIRETRRYNEDSGTTISMRSKEEAHDYRYFPEPDIPPVYISSEELSAIKAELPEMPEARFDRYISLGLSESDALLIVSSKAMSDFFDAATAIHPNYRRIAGTLLVDVNYHLNSSAMTISDVRFSPSDIAELVRLCDDGIISKNAAKDILKIMFCEGGSPGKIAEERGFIMSSDTSALEIVIDEILAANPTSVEQYRSGIVKVFAFFMGQAMRKIGAGADPKLVKETLTRKLEEI